MHCTNTPVEVWVFIEIFIILTAGLNEGGQLDMLNKAMFILENAYRIPCRVEEELNRFCTLSDLSFY